MRNCLKFKHFFALLSLMAIIPLFQGEKPSRAGRSIASYIPDDDVAVVPTRVRKWTEDILVEDDAGVLSRIGATFNSWNSRREYAEQWNLQSTGYFNTPGADHRKNFLKRQFLRYLDKRITGGIKKAHKDSGLHQIAKVQGALRPSTEASVSENIKLKFRAKVLRGLVSMNVINPWVDCTTEFQLDGDVRMRLNRKIEVIDLDARLNYLPLDKSFVAELDRPISENVLARISTRKPAGGSTLDNTLHLMYNKGF